MQGHIFRSSFRCIPCGAGAEDRGRCSAFGVRRSAFGVRRGLGAAPAGLSKPSIPARCFWLGACETLKRLRIDLAGRPAPRSRREALQSRPVGATPKPHLMHDARMSPVQLPARSGRNALAAPIKKTCPFEFTRHGRPTAGTETRPALLPSEVSQGESQKGKYRFSG